MRNNLAWLLVLTLVAAARAQKADPKPPPPPPPAPGQPASAPAPAQPQAEGSAPPEKGERAAPAGDLDALRKEYETLRESLFTSRARAAAVGDAVYSAKVQVQLRHG